MRTTRGHPRTAERARAATVACGSPAAGPGSATPRSRASRTATASCPATAGSSISVFESRETSEPHAWRRDLAQRRVELRERRGPRAELAFGELVERRVHGVEVGVQVLGLALDVEEPGHDLALRLVLGEMVHRRDAVIGVVAGVELAQHQRRP